MDLRTGLFGDRPARLRVAGLTVLLPVLASIAFLLEFDQVLGGSVIALSVLIALYAGWDRAGLFAGLGAVFVAILWRFVFPPLVGYLRWSTDARYAPPWLVDEEGVDPTAELIEGVANGAVYALVGAVLLGGLGYLWGLVFRLSREQRATPDRGPRTENSD